jgi:hypothetical protein
MIAVVLAAVGLAVLAVCGVRLAFALRRLSREVRRTRSVLEPKRAALKDELTRSGGSPR